MSRAGVVARAEREAKATDGLGHDASDEKHPVLLILTRPPL